MEARGRKGRWSEKRKRRMEEGEVFPSLCEWLFTPQAGEKEEDRTGEEEK
jgi:hypothetical protein